MKVTTAVLAVFFAAALLLWGGASEAQEPAADAQSEALSDYLHGQRLPLVNARILRQDGARSVLLYGFVATEQGKQHAVQRTTVFLRDPTVTVLNRIKVRPELLTLARPSSAGTQEQEEGAAAPDFTQESQPSPNSDQQPLASPTPANVGDAQAYENQQHDDESRYATQGAPGILIMPFSAGLLNYGTGLYSFGSPSPVYQPILPYAPAMPYGAAPFNPYSPYSNPTYIRGPYGAMPMPAPHYYAPMPFAGRSFGGHFGGGRR